MLGAVIGDVVGSRFERSNHKTADIYDFELFGRRTHFTDDTVMTLALAKAVLECRGDWEGLSAKAIESMRSFGRIWPYAGYGGGFKRWLLSSEPAPYNSFGNGAGMRVSACGWAAGSAEDAAEMSRLVTMVTHDHPEGLKGAAAVATGIRLALEGLGNAEIRESLRRGFYPLDFTIEGIRGEYFFDVSCQGSVPQAITAFLEASGFEEAVRLAVSLGGDTDTICAMTGSLAEARWGIPEDMRLKAMTYLPKMMASVVEEFEAAYPPKILPPETGIDGNPRTLESWAFERGSEFF